MVNDLSKFVFLTGKVGVGTTLLVCTTLVGLTVAIGLFGLNSIAAFVTVVVPVGVPVLLRSSGSPIAPGAGLSVEELAIREPRKKERNRCIALH